MDNPDLPCNCLALRQASRHVTQFYDAVLAPTGLRTTQFSILARLEASGPWSIQALAARLVMDRTTLGRTIRPLEREGLLSIGPSATDRRTSMLAITPKGAGVLAQALARWRAAQRSFEDTYGPANAAALRAALDAVSRTKL